MRKSGSKIASLALALALAVALSVLQSFRVAHAQSDRPVIVLQPGHGELGDDGTTIDPGASYNGLVEKDINLAVAKYTQSYLQRCPVAVYLTREGDDKEHNLVQVRTIVESHHPTVAVAIHTDVGSSGTQGWYTDGGFDDARSKMLADMLAADISAQMGIHQDASKPDSQDRLGRLYIKDWKVPTALIEIGRLQGDYELLVNNRKEFARGVARAILEYMGIPPTCADDAVPQGGYAATYFPADEGSNTIEVLNDGLVPWSKTEYLLKSTGKSYGAGSDFALSADTQAGATAKWKLAVKAPDTPGVYRQVWQVWRGDVKVGKEITIYIIVVPQQAKDLKESIDKKIEELKKQGQKALDDYMRELETQLLEWAQQQVTKQCAPQAFVPLLAALVVAGRRRQKGLSRAG